MSRQHRPSTTAPKHFRILYVSPEAWIGILDLCTQWRVGKRRVGAMLAVLPPDPEFYVDRRPQEWKDQDVAMLEADQWPLWSYEYPRMQHNVMVDDATIDKLASIARHFNITMSYHKSKWDHDMSRVNALMEAVGTDLLVIRLDR
jgi:hypothetical protein